MLQLERDNRAGMLVLHILDQKTGKRTEVRGKLGYETNGYDPEDKLHQILDKVGKSASVSDLMNGDVVSINPRHPQGPAALKVAHDLTNESNPFTNARMNAIKAGKTEFTVGGKTYKVTGDTSDEEEAVANENFADGKNPERKGLAKRVGVDTKASVSDLRKTAKNSSGEKQRMAHWLANMKAGKAKNK